MKVQKQNMNVTTSYLILARHVKQQNDLNILSLWADSPGRAHAGSGRLTRRSCFAPDFIEEQRRLSATEPV